VKKETSSDEEDIIEKKLKELEEKQK